MCIQQNSGKCLPLTPSLMRERLRARPVALTWVGKKRAKCGILRFCNKWFCVNFLHFQGENDSLSLILPANTPRVASTQFILQETGRVPEGKTEYIFSDNVSVSSRYRLLLYPTFRKHFGTVINTVIRCLLCRYTFPIAASYQVPSH